MRVVKRWLVNVVWLLSLALPLQGLASVLPAAAMATMHGGASEVVPSPQAHPCHQAAADTPDAALPAAGCAACAACHAASAPAPQVPALAAPLPPTAALPAWHAPTVPSVVPAGLDRPPRTILA
jgi:cytochrome c553